ncbi:hypothetical protein [Aquitalea magnusonii]|nr:hypothetical protein [Aquitalea magnusonii]
MSIRIVPVEQLAERQAASLDITPLLLPQPATLYQQRAGPAAASWPPVM